MSIFFLPAIGLFWLGYRIQGIPCTYKPEVLDVVTLVQVTKNQYSFMRAFPFIMLLVVAGLVYLIGMAIN